VKQLVYICAFCMFSHHMYAQVSSFKIKDQSFIEPTMDGISYLFTHVDSVDWNNVMFPLGFKSIPPYKKVNALEYKKEVEGISEYVGFDDQYWVLTFIWKDPSGKNLISKNLRKALKKNEYNSSGTYKIQYNGLDFIISMESNKEKAVYEMITIEQERK
jgi:hypothetical protein